MALTVEAAVVTKKGAANPFNTDSVNAAGKVWPPEVIHSEKGVRVVGSHKGVPYYVLAGSDTKGTAQSAADLFQNCVSLFREDGSNCAVLLSDYLNSFAKVLIESGFASSDCSFAVLAGFNDTVYVGKSGNSRIYTYYDSTFTEITPEMKPFADGKASCGVAQCSNVKAGDVFLLLSGKVAAVFPDGLLKAVCEKSEGDVKKIAGLISSQAAKYGYEDAVSAIVVKITDVEVPTAVPAAAPVLAEEEAEAPVRQPEDGFAKTPDEIAAAISAAVAEKETTVPEEEVSEAEEPVKPVKKGKRAGVIILITLLALAVLAVVYFFVSGASEKYFGAHGSKETTIESTSSETESETESESVSESLTADEPESTTEEESTQEEEATVETTTEARTTRRETTTRSNATTKAPETTEAPSVEETTDRQVEEGTTEAPESTTEENNTEATTEKQEEPKSEQGNEDTSAQTSNSEEETSDSGETGEEEQA